MKNSVHILLLLVLLLASACRITKHLQEDELLITQTNIQFEQPKKNRGERAFKSQLETVIQPVPNTGLFKLRAGIYQWADRKDKKIRKRIKNIFGEAPAIYRQEEQDRNLARMRKMLKDNGFFDSDLKMDTTVQEKKVAITYRIATDGQYHLRNIKMPSDTSAIGRLIIENKEATLLKPSAAYSELRLAEERQRIATLAADNGFFDFNQNFIYYLVDTIPGTLTADVYIRVKMPEGQEDHEQIRLGRTTVYPNFDLSNNGVGNDLDTVYYGHHFFIEERDHIVKHKLLDEMILQDTGELFVKKFQDASVNHLLNLGIFKFVNLKYERVESDTGGQVINRNFYLTPSSNQNFSADLELNNRTGRFYGIGASTNYTHRNLLKRALTFTTSLSGGLETQVGSQLGLFNTLDLNVQTSLSTPRLMVPFQLNEYERLSLPKSTLNIGNNYQRRIGLYTLNATNLKMGYQWKQSERVQHSLYPVSINMVNVLNKSSELDSLIDLTPRLKNSFINLFIAGLEYVHVFTNQGTSAENSDSWFMKSKFRSSGNLLQLTSGIFNAPKGSDNQYEVLGLPFAQFVTLDFDFRYYKKLRNNTLAFRLSPGIGLAYGNSEVLPYTEQFFVGGANSLRAFRLRGLGPGTFARENVSDSGLSGQFIDQTGDIKLEANVEYRFSMLGPLKGALFVDAGNVWLLNDDSVEGGQFNSRDFWKEIGVGAGFGFRFDLEFVVIRFDLGVPLRAPYYKEGFQWTFDRFEIGSSKWRGDNLIGNLAIGYPF